MIYYIVLYSLIVLIFFSSVYLMWHGSKNKKIVMGIRFKRNRFKDFKNNIKEQLDDTNTNAIFEQAGFKLSSSTYQIIRYFIISLWVLILLYNKFFAGNFSRYSLAFLILAFIISSPRNEFLGRKSPLLMILDLFQNEFKNKKNKEIYRALSQLKNLSIVSSDESLGSDYVLEELMKFTRITKPIFSKFLSMWYEADRAAACEYFSNAVGTKEGKELSSLFLKLDDLNPSELKHQIELYQSMVKSEKQTYKEKKNEIRGTVIYSMVMFSAIVVLLNFVIVVITIDALSFYKSIFK